MPGPAPKPSHLRQRTNQKAGNAMITAPESPNVPEIPNPDARVWHPLTVVAWEHAWQSPMSTQWLEADVDALGQLFVLMDEFYKAPDGKLMAEIRLQRQCFGLTPLDRSRLQWEVNRAEEAEQKQHRRQPVRQTGTDPRAVLSMIK
jgi:hypothetical protein